MSILGTNKGSNYGTIFDAKTKNSNNLWPKMSALTIGKIESTMKVDQELLAKRMEGSREKPANQNTKTKHKVATS